MRLNVFYSGEFGKKVVGNLINSDSFCFSCGELCDHCRSSRTGFAHLLTGIFELRTDIPDFVEDPMEYIPADLPECDLIIAIDLHPDLLMAVPDIAKVTGSKAVIIPVDDSRLVPAGLTEQVKNKLDSMGVECECPKPFCSLDITGKKHIDEFVNLGFGRPELLISTDIVNGLFTHIEVIRDAPCGATWFVAKKLKWSDVANYKENISNAHHSYPCTASMEKDAQIGDTILHEAGYIIRKSVEDAMNQE